MQALRGAARAAQGACSWSEAARQIETANGRAEVLSMADGDTRYGVLLTGKTDGRGARQGDRSRLDRNSERKGSDAVTTAQASHRSV
eukprot:921887-Pyramimonas_sp.AAC.1